MQLPAVSNIFQLDVALFSTMVYNWNHDTGKRWSQWCRCLMVYACDCRSNGWVKWWLPAQLSKSSWAGIFMSCHIYRGNSKKQSRRTQEPFLNAYPCDHTAGKEEQLRKLLRRQKRIETEFNGNGVFRGSCFWRFRLFQIGAFSEKPELPSNWKKLKNKWSVSQKISKSKNTPEELS